MSREKRLSWEQYFQGICETVSKRGTCDRLRCGVVIVKDRNILATGYNGSLSGELHCDEIGHDMVGGHCVRTTHAEANAVAQAAKRGVSLNGATAYITATPCWLCFKLLRTAGVVNFVCGREYRMDKRIDYYLAMKNIGFTFKKKLGKGRK